MKQRDLVGHQFNKMTVIGTSQKKCANKNFMYWTCQCECGNIKEVREDHIFDGKIISCGCHKDKLTRERMKTHEDSSSSLYGRWSHIKGRCCCPTDDAYVNYGSRGITMCDEWTNSYESFRDWSLANGYQPDLSIDRIDNNKGYSPENCRWASVKIQANNKRNNHMITYNGETHTLAEWAEMLGLTQATLRQRLNKHHWTIERAMSTPQKIRNNVKD